MVLLQHAPRGRAAQAGEVGGVEGVDLGDDLAALAGQARADLGERLALDDTPAERLALDETHDEAAAEAVPGCST